MDFIGLHLKECPHCRGEYQSLLDTKRLLASLAHRTSRADIESLLRSEEEQRLLEPAASGLFRGALRPKPLAATALLSLAGLWIASASLDTPADGIAPGAVGFSSPVTAAVMPGLGMGKRGLQYLSGWCTAALPPLLPYFRPTRMAW
jgi:anti-sigma factor RsiW